MKRSLLEWWSCWVGLCHQKKSERAWRSVFFARTWTIWETRNNKVFKDGVVNIFQAEDSVRFRVAWWFKYLGDGTVDPIIFVVLNMALCCTESKKRKFPKLAEWIPPLVDVLKFNVDGSARGSPGPAGIGVFFEIITGKSVASFRKMLVSMMPYLLNYLR